MKTLPLQIRKNGYDYNLLTRSGKHAIYSQSYENTIIGYEVFKIYVRGERYSDILNRALPSTERYPSNGSFGYSAWAYIDLQDAISKYKELELNSKK